MLQVSRKNLLTWLIPTLCVAILVPLIIFISFSKVGFHKDYVPNKTNIAFYIGSFSIAWYGLFYFFGFACAIFLACFKMWKLYKIPIDPFYWYCLMGIPTSILGGRIGSCILGPLGGGTDWKDFWAFRFGGMAVEWGVALTVILGLIYFPLILRNPKYQVRDELDKPVSVRQVSMWLYCDAIVPTILIGQVIGRYGNYMNQEIYGNAINGEWGKFIHNLFPYMTGVEGSDKTTPSVTYQPLFLIESFFNFWGLILIYFVFEFIPFKKAGDLGLLYFLWYGILRTALEPLRDSNFTQTNNLSFAFSIVWIVVAIALLILNHTVFPKSRKYFCKYIIWEWLRYVFSRNKQRWQNVKNDKERKPQEMLYYFGR